MLENTLYKIKYDKKLTVGYFGGSITEGAGASEPAYCWREQSGKWLKETFPDCEFTCCNAAIGGTGSMLGIFRMERDLLSKKPDLVFIEFSVNDSPVAYEETLANSETLLRKLWAANPYADAVYVHTTTQSISGCLSTGGEYVSRAAHSAVMHHYGVPQLDVGEMLRAKILLGGGDWMKYTTDTVHPNNDGYSIYANAVIAMLREALTGDRETALAAKVLPSPMTALDRLDARLEDAGGVLADGWQVVESSLCGRYPRYLQATEPGAAFTCKFTGSRIGLYCMFAKDSGDITYSIDGGEEITRTMWDSYCLHFNRAYPLMLCDTLAPGEHELRVRVSDTKNEQSEGHAIRIGAFMIY